MKKDMTVDGHKICIYQPDIGQPEKAQQPSVLEECPVVYMFGDSEAEADQIWSLIEDKRCVLVCIGGFDWNRDMSPWPAPKVFRGGEDFGGRADELLALLIEKVVPETESLLGYTPPGRGLIGYSLGGIFALYTLYETDVFDRIGSVSGSMWYDRWLTYMESKCPKPAAAKVYLSLGEKEKHTKNPKLAAVEDCTKQARDILLAQGAEVLFELNPGNHFADVAIRCSKAIEWLI